MKYLVNINTLGKLKKIYYKLAVIHHPDNGGNTEIMKAINNEYDILFPIYRDRYNANAKQKNNETAESTRSEFYTQHGWKGTNYQIGLGIKEITQKVRCFIKENFPILKFSVTRDRNSIVVSLMEANFNPFTDENRLKKGYEQLNHTYLQTENRINDRAKEVFQRIYEYMKSYNYDDSDAMIDYFNSNFYINLHIGKWDKPFKIVEKQERLSKTKTNKMIDKSKQSATSRQLWALHCITQLNTKDLNLSKDKASELISRSKAGEDIMQEINLLMV